MTRSETSVEDLKILCHLVVKSLKNVSSMDAEAASRNKRLVGSIFAQCASDAIGTTMELDVEGHYKHLDVKNEEE